MSTLLHIQVSPMGDNSISLSVAEEFLTAWKEANPSGNIIERNLATNPVPVLDGEANGLAGKKVTAIIAQGGSYKTGSPREGWDYGSGYLELVFTALGSTDVTVVVSEFGLAGVAPGMEDFVDAKSSSIAAAKTAARDRAAA